MSFRVDGGERKYTLGIFLFIFSIYLTLSGFFSHKFYPSIRKSYLIRRDSYIKISNKSISWCFWKDDTYWSSTDSKIRSNHFFIKEILLGKESRKYYDIEVEYHDILLREGKYYTKVTKYLEEIKFSRWFTKKSLKYKVECVKYKNGEWIESFVPCPNEGDDSPEKEIGVRHIFYEKGVNTCEKASKVFRKYVESKRPVNWVPKSFRKKFERSDLIDKILKNGI